MGRILLVTGGARSGKSHFAESLCLAAPGPSYYIATCPRILGDHDLDARIAAHQEKRSGHNWITLEEPLHIEQALQQASTAQGSVLLECLGLWVSNMVYQGIENRREAEAELRGRVQRMCAQWRMQAGSLIIVGQEAGWGVLPAERESRLWLDLLGCVRNAFAAEADEVWLVASGCPIQIKRQMESR